MLCNRLTNLNSALFMKKIYKLAALIFPIVSINFTVSAQYCSSTFIDGCSWGDDISNFTLNGETSSINNPDTEGCSSTGYSNLTSAFLADAIMGNTYSGSISNWYSCCQYARIWIDYNNNGVFETSESIFTSGEYYDGLPATFSFTVPMGITPGTKTLRVRSVYGTTGIDPCTTYDYGETHDYSILILSNCEGPTGISSIVTSGTTAEISWTTVGSPISTVIEYGPTGFTSGSGTTVTATSSPVTITDLIPATEYEYTVVHECTPGNFSIPTTKYNFTTPCITPSILSMETIGVCGSGEVTITGTSTPHSVIRWYDTESMTTLLHEGPTFITPLLDASTTYYAIASVGNDCYSAIQEVTAIIYPIPTLELTPIHQIICVNDTTTISATVDPDYSYVWSTGETSSTIQVYEVGEYSVEVTDENNCVNTGSSTLEIYDVATIDGFDFVPLYFSEHRTVQFEAINPAAIVDYHWDFGDGNTSSEASPIHTYLEDGTYNVKLLVSNDCSADSADLNIFILPNNTGIDDLNNLNNLLDIYPNPVAGDYITIELNGNGVNNQLQTITVMNVLGQVVDVVNTNNKSIFSYDISKLAHGVYYFKIENTLNQSGIRKVIKK